jgi:hypothetical protein
VVRSISDVPVFEDTFCVDHPSLVGPFEGYTREIQDLLDKSEYLQGRLLWLWPHKDKMSKSATAKTLAVDVPYSSNNPFLQGYR